MHRFPQYHTCFLFTFILASCLFYASCNDDDAGESTALPTRLEWIDCHNAEDDDWDVEKLQAALIGEWQMIGFTCAINASEGIDESNNFIAATFNPDGSMEIYEYDTLVHTATWTLDPDNVYGVDIVLVPYAYQIDGIPYFCQGKLMLVAPLDDGCWAYLERP